MIVVADTSPINYLVLINEIEILPERYGAVVIPQAVQEELLRPVAPEIVECAPPKHRHGSRFVLL